MGDVLRFPHQGLGLDLDAIDHGRVDEEGGHRHHHPARHRRQGQGPAGPGDVDDEDHRSHDRDRHQQVEGGQAGVDVGVARAEERLRLPARVEEGQGVHAVHCRPHQGQDGEQDRDVHLGSGREGGERAAPDADAAVQVVGQGRDHHHRHQQVEQPAQGDVDQRELEDVEADVEGEDRVGEAEVLLPEVEEDVVAPARHAQSDEQGQRQGPQQADPAGPALGPAPETGHQLLLLGQILGEEAGCEAIGQVEVDPDQQPGEQHPAGAEGQAGRPAPGPDRGETDRVEPEIVGPEGTERRQDQIDQGDPGQDVGQTAATITLAAGGRGSPREHRGGIVRGPLPHPPTPAPRWASGGDDGAVAVPVHRGQLVARLGRRPAGGTHAPGRPPPPLPAVGVENLAQSAVVGRQRQAAQSTLGLVGAPPPEHPGCRRLALPRSRSGRREGRTERLGEIVAHLRWRRCPGRDGGGSRHAQLGGRFGPGQGRLLTEGDQVLVEHVLEHLFLRLPAPEPDLLQGLVLDLAQRPFHRPQRLVGDRQQEPIPGLERIQSVLGPVLDPGRRLRCRCWSLIGFAGGGRRLPGTAEPAKQLQHLVGLGRLRRRGRHG